MFWNGRLYVIPPGRLLTWVSPDSMYSMERVGTSGLRDLTCTQSISDLSVLFIL